MYDDNNVFAKILRRELDCEIVYEDGFVMSILDINPLAPVHALVLAKGEYTDFDDLMSKGPYSMILGYFAGVDSTLESLGVKETGYRLIINNGRDACQEINHLHTHILGGGNLGLPEKNR